MVNKYIPVEYFRFLLLKLVAFQSTPSFNIAYPFTELVYAKLECVLIFLTQPLTTILSLPNALLRLLFPF